MKKNACLMLILMTGLLTGCGTHLSHQFATGRQMPITPTHAGISIPLDSHSEVLLSLRGCRLGLTPQAESRNSITSQPESMPWLSYRLHF